MDYDPGELIDVANVPYYIRLARMVQAPLYCLRVPTFQFGKNAKVPWTDAQERDGPEDRP